MVVVLIFYFNSVAPHSASVHIAYKYTTPGEKKQQQQQQLTPTTFRAFSLKKKNSLHLILEKHGFRVFQKLITRKSVKLR